MEQEPTKAVEFVNLDDIPSPHMEPASPTPMVEEAQPTTVVGMDIDMKETGQGQQAEDAGNPSHPEHAEGAQRVNGTAPKHTEVVAPGQSHTTEPEQQQEGLVEDVTDSARSLCR
jgi:hypothetical protein